MMNIVFWLFLSCVRSGPQASPSSDAPVGFAVLESSSQRFTSAYSTILLKDSDSIRSMYFVRDSGELALETSMNMEQPSLLMIPYTQIMMGVFLFHSSPKSALMIGLGGGAMAQHIQKYHSYLTMDAVDIDPEILRLAQEYFAVRPNERLRLHADDGFDFIARCEDRYDILFMDAFLKPSEDTDSTGTPVRFKTMDFYKQINRCLTKDGVVAFNINRSSSLKSDLKNIEDSFVQTWIVPVPNRGNVVVFATNKKEIIPRGLLKKRSISLERSIPSSLSYEHLFSIINPK